MKNIVFGYLLKAWHDAAGFNNDIIISQIKPTKTATVLDIGFFRGELVIKRFQKIPKSKIYAIDFDQAAISSAKNLRLKTKKYNIEKGLPYKSNFFDIVVANQMIEHLVNIDLFVEEIYRILKPKGYVIVSTENLSSWHNLFALFLGWQAFSQHISKKINIGNPMRLIQSKQEFSDIHIKIFTPRGLKDLFLAYNFKVEKTFGAGYYPFYGQFARILSKLDSRHCAFIGIKAKK